MSKLYRCVHNRDEDDSFIVGKVYTLTDEDRVTGEDGFTWGPHYPEGTIQWLENHGWYRFEEVKSMEFIVDGKINTDALKTGDWVEVVKKTGGNMLYQVLKDTPWGVVFREKPYGTSSVVDVENLALDNVLPVSGYMSVRVYRSGSFIGFCCLSDKPCNLVFEWNNEPKRKRMTVDEIESALGYKVAIVDAEGKEEK